MLQDLQSSGQKSVRVSEKHCRLEVGKTDERDFRCETGAKSAVKVPAVSVIIAINVRENSLLTELCLTSLSLVQKNIFQGLHINLIVNDPYND